MHTVILTIVLSVGAGEHRIVNCPPESPIASPSRIAVTREGAPDLPGPYRYDPPRDPQDTDTIPQAFFKYCNAWFQPMPQTCYGPHYGCYPGNNRDIHRYPAFHGYYYRHAYNYRQLYEYPWQADPFEPLPLEVNNNPAVGMDGQGSPQEKLEIINKPSSGEPRSVPK